MYLKRENLVGDILKSSLERLVLLIYFFLIWGFFFFFFFLLLFRETGRDRRREKNIDVGEKHRLVAFCRHWDWGIIHTQTGGSNPPPRCEPWLGIEPLTFWLWDDLPTNWATLARATLVTYFFSKFFYRSYNFKSNALSSLFLHVFEKII